MSRVPARTSDVSRGGRPGVPASTPLATPAALALHNTFVQSVKALRQSLVRSMYFLVEIQRRKIHFALGYGTITDYAAAVAGLSRNQTEVFLSLGRKLEAYPEVRRALETGRLSWSKAGVIVQRASPDEESRWVDAAKSLGMKALREALPRPSSEPAAVGMTETSPSDVVNAGSPAQPEPQNVPDRPALPHPRAAAPAPRPLRSPDEKCHVTYAFTPEQYARWSAHHEAIRRRGGRDSREDLLLEGLESLASTAGTRGSQTGPGYVVHLHACPDCDRAEIGNARGRFRAPPALMEAARCDGVVEDAGLHRRATVPPRLRRSVLKRDRRKCQAPGCRHASHLEIHHRLPVAQGGRTELENLVTLCRRCHRALHEREDDLSVVAMGPPNT